MADDIWNLSPAEAAARLEAMNPPPPAVDLAAPVNVEAMTSSQARLRLEGLLENPEWQKRYLAGNGPERRESEALTAKKNEVADNRLDRIIDGTEIVRELETVANGELSTFKMMQAAEHMKSFVNDTALIKQALTSAPVSRAEYDAVKTLRGELMADKDFTDALLAGNPVAVREFTLMNTIVANGYVAEAT
jgi:hypothetical protein